MSFRNLLTLAFGLALVATPVAAASYQVDGTHSSAVFSIKHFGVSNFYGTFGEIQGTIEYDAANPGASAIQLTIAADSVRSRHSQRDDHIKSPDFLNAKQFPTVEFKSKSVSAKGDGFEVKGDLTLHGVTKEITVMVQKTGEGKHPRSGKELIGFESRFTVDRTEHDMNFMAGPLSEEIGFIIAVEAVKQ
jgi:polyisoprenoid-binding protein YceI